MLTFGPKSSQMRLMALLKRGSKRKLPIIKLSVDLFAPPVQINAFEFHSKDINYENCQFFVLASTSRLSFVVSKRLNYIDWVLMWGSMA